MKVKVPHTGDRHRDKTTKIPQDHQKSSDDFSFSYLEFLKKYILRSIYEEKQEDNIKVVLTG